MVRIRIHVPDTIMALGALAGLALAAVGLAWLVVLASTRQAPAACRYGLAHAAGQPAQCSAPAPASARADCLATARLLHVPASQARQACSQR